MDQTIHAKCQTRNCRHTEDSYVKGDSEDTILYDSNSLEIPIGIEGYGPLLRGVESLKKNDPDNGIAYELGVPSNPYLVFFLNALAEKSSTSTEARHQVRRRLSAMSRTNRNEADSTLFGHLLSRLRYLKDAAIFQHKVPISEGAFRASFKFPVSG